MNKRVQIFDIFWGVSYEVVEILCGLCDCEGEGVALGVKDGRGMRLRREHEFTGEGEEVLESEGKRVFEIGKYFLQEVIGGVKKLVEENDLH